MKKLFLLLTAFVGTWTMALACTNLIVGKNALQMVLPLSLILLIRMDFMGIFAIILQLIIRKER